MTQELKIDWCTYQAAEYACKNWHYSKSIPVGKLTKIGAWENGIFIGCIIFGRGACMNLLKPYGLEPTQGCELVRVALKEHKTNVSRIMKIAINFLKKKYKLRLIVSYADPMQKHLGIIYQASNWVYVGETEKTKIYKDKNGRMHHSRRVSKTGFIIENGFKQKCLKYSDCEKIVCVGKHKYLYPLDSEMRKQIEPLRKPYPKRLTKATVSDQDISGGAVPTRTLQ